MESSLVASAPAMRWWIWLKGVRGDQSSCVCDSSVPRRASASCTVERMLVIKIQIPIASGMLLLFHHMRLAIVS